MTTPEVRAALASMVELLNNMTARLATEDGAAMVSDVLDVAIATSFMAALFVAMIDAEPRTTQEGAA